MQRIILLIVPMLALLWGMTACKNNDNEPEQPTEKKARYAILVYGNAGCAFSI